MITTRKPKGQDKKDFPEAILMLKVGTHDMPLTEKEVDTLWHILREKWGKHHQLLEKDILLKDLTVVSEKYPETTFKYYFEAVSNSHVVTYTGNTREIEYKDIRPLYDFWTNRDDAPRLVFIRETDDIDSEDIKPLIFKGGSNE